MRKANHRSNEPSVPEFTKQGVEEMEGMFLDHDPRLLEPEEIELAGAPGYNPAMDSKAEEEQEGAGNAMAVADLGRPYTLQEIQAANGAWNTMGEEQWGAFLGK
jgi:hypothetical protein